MTTFFNDCVFIKKTILRETKSIVKKIITEDDEVINELQRKFSNCKEIRHLKEAEKLSYKPRSPTKRNYLELDNLDDYVAYENLIIQMKCLIQLLLEELKTASEEKKNLYEDFSGFREKIHKTHEEKVKIAQNRSELINNELAEAQLQSKQAQAQSKQFLKDIKLHKVLCVN